MARTGYNPTMLRARAVCAAETEEDFYILGNLYCLAAADRGVDRAGGAASLSWPVLFALLLALMPATQGGVDLINSTVSSLLHAEALHKLDFRRAFRWMRRRWWSCRRCC